MPHSTRSSPPIRAPSFKFPPDTTTTRRISMEKFPDYSDTSSGSSPYPSSPVKTNGYSNGSPTLDRWQPKRDTGQLDSSWANGQTSFEGRHSKQKSLGDAFRTMRTRRASVSANVVEIGGALKAPVSPKLIVCTFSLHNGMDADRDCRFFASFGTCQVRSRIPLRNLS